MGKKCKQCNKRALNIKGYACFCSKTCKLAYYANRKKRQYQAQGGIELPQDRIEFYNYKLPLKRFEDGFGYLGTVAVNKDRDMVQCHFCGLFYRGVNSIHILKCLGVKEYKAKNPGIELNNVTDYKKIIQLNPSTCLIGEQTRERLIKAGVVNYAKNPLTQYHGNKHLAHLNTLRTGSKI